MVPNIPSGWDELSMKQIAEVHHIISTCNNKIERNLKIFLYLTDMHIVKHRGGVDESDGKMRYVLQKKGDKKNEYLVRSDELERYLDGVQVVEDTNERIKKRYAKEGKLSWVDNPVGKDGMGGLISLPDESITIGGRKYLLPTPLITNITYEQYSNAQKLQQAAWEFADRLRKLQEEIEAVQSKEAGKEQIEELVKQAKEPAELLNEMRARFVAHMLTPRKRRISYGILMENLTRLPWHWSSPMEDVYEYKSDRAEMSVKWMEKHAPEWLFDVLVQHLQSCLGLYKKQFPELFNGSGDGGRDIIPLVAEVETVNAIMKWQSYTGQQAVYDSNAIQIFGVLNSMTKEAKAIEEANAKMKSHSKH